jgi:hypothetical protein
MTTDELIAAVHTSWSQVPAPPEGDMDRIEWECGPQGARALIGVSPVDVDISSPGFLGCTPLLDIKPNAAAAYLGTYILSLLRGVSLQEKIGLFHDVVTRAHVLTCLQQETFWRIAIRPHLPQQCRRTLQDLALYLESRRELLALSPEQTAKITALASK